MTTQQWENVPLPDMPDSSPGGDLAPTPSTVTPELESGTAVVDAAEQGRGSR